MAPPTVTVAPDIAFGAADELRLVVLCHGPRNPSDGAWETYLQLLRQVPFGKDSVRILVHTEGGHPTRQQQMRMYSVLATPRTKVAVISASIAARFVTSILVLTNPDIRCFAPNQREQAYGHIGLIRSQSNLVDALVAQVKRGLAQAASA